MDYILLISVIVLQNIAVVLDNQGVFYLTKNFKQKNIAKTFATKHQIDFLSRGFLFFAPPLLGFMLIKNNLDLILLTFSISSLISLLTTFFQCYELNFKLHLKFKEIKISIWHIFIGIMIFSFYMYVPFYLNIISYFFKEDSLWIVQLSPSLTMLSSAFVVFFLDPKLAKFIDSKNKNDSAVVLEMMMMRIIGRLFLVFISVYIYLKFY